MSLDWCPSSGPKREDKRGVRVCPTVKIIIIIAYRFLQVIIRLVRRHFALFLCDYRLVGG